MAKETPQTTPMDDGMLVEFTTTTEYVTNCTNIIYSICEWDAITKDDAARKKAMFNKCIDILELCLNEMHEGLFDK